MCKLQKQYDYFKRNKSILIEDHKNEVLVISNELDVHAFPTMEMAYTFGAQKYGLGNFMIQRCTEQATRVQVMSNLGMKIV